MKEKRPSYSKIKSLKTLKTLSMLECDKILLSSYLFVLTTRFCLVWNFIRKSFRILFQTKLEVYPLINKLVAKFMNATYTRMSTIEATQQNQEASIQNLEKQIGQLVKLVSERTLETFPSNTEVNPRERVNAISVRCDEEVLKEETVMIMQEKSCIKKER
ncbi:hypothetical protein M9H77_35724 [Catharanthus roseus]|uniref:Uncharacterized protein n=1 Tax=Catharanthus roseus TaxID=4058 RepID=A0ACB9ZQR8_CATRO|nr:hypothetical protein M9H77_35724 [Catharanthus roseus]